MRKFVLATVLLLALAACNGAATDSDAPALDLEDEIQRASYAQGFRIGQQGESIPIQVDAFLAGVRDGLGGEGQLDDTEMQTALADFNRIMTEAASAAAAEALEAGREWLAENAARPEVQVTDSGLQYEVIEEGDGPKPAATDVVRVHYTGTLIDGTKFDSSYDGEGQPAEFPLNRVIPGWTEGLQLMSVGSTYNLYLPGPLGYGENPQPGGVIKPNDTLIFEVTLLEIVEQ